MTVLEWRSLTEDQKAQEGSTLHMAFATAEFVDGPRMIMCSVWRSTDGWVWKIALQGEETEIYAGCASLEDGQAKCSELLENWPQVAPGDTEAS